MKTHKQRGFTVIEVMIVVAIIGVIFTVVFIAAASAQRTSRDNARKNIAARLITDIAQYATDNSGKITDFTCATGCSQLNDPDTNNDHSDQGAAGDSATASSGVLYVLGAKCGSGSFDGTAVAGKPNSYAVLYWTEASQTSHCLDGSTSGSITPNVPVTTPPPDTTPPPVVTPPATTSPETAHDRDVKKIDELGRIHTALVNYQRLHGYLPHTTEYGESDAGGWDYSTAGDFMTFLDPRAVPPAPNSGTGDLFFCESGHLTYSPTTACTVGYGLGYYCYASSLGDGRDGTSLGARLEDPGYYSGNPRMHGGSTYYEFYQDNIGQCGNPPATTIAGSENNACVYYDGLYCETFGSSIYSCGNFRADFPLTNVVPGSHRLTIKYDDHNCQNRSEVGGSTRPPGALYQFNINIFVNDQPVATNVQFDPAGGTKVIDLGDDVPDNATISIEWNNNYWVTDDSNPYKYDPDFQIDSIGVGP